MRTRSLPVRPDLAALQHQALALGIADLDAARTAVANSYGAVSWQRLEHSCVLIDAIWRDDLAAVRALIVEHPHLIHENAGIGNDNWGPPLSYAANLGRDRLVLLLHQHGATDLMHGLDRAILQSQIPAARLLHQLLGSPKPPPSLLEGAAYTLSVSGTALFFELGGELALESGKRVAPVHVVLETDARNPEAKHQILAMYAEHGFVYPDTAMMALHRGRLDLLDRHLRSDPDLLRRTFSYEKVCPPSLGCHEEWLPRTTLDGATLLHVCVDYDELAIATWLLEQGMPVDAPAATDAEGFGGQTALFHSVVCFANFWNNLHGAESATAIARLLLQRGANVDARASLRERLFVDQQPAGVREHRRVTALEWGEAYHNPMMVNRAAMGVIAGRGGR